MNVLEVVFSLGIGGTERTAENFAIGLKKHKNDVVMFSSKGGVREKNLVECGIRVLHSFEELIHISKEWIADVIHFHSHGLDYPTILHIKQIFPAALCCEQNVFATPTIFGKEMDISFQLSTWCMWNYTNRKTSHHISKVAILPNPINVENFFPISSQERMAFRDRYQIPHSSIVLLRIGQPFEAKWNIKMIDIYRDLQKKYSDLILVCVGAPDSLKYEVSQLARDIRQGILFIDKIIGDTNLRQCYGAADIFLHMTRIGESFGIVLAEAILCGLPVVTLQTPYADNSQAEVVGHNIGGLVANRYTGVYEAVTLLLENRQLRNLLVAQGQKSIKERFSLDSVIDKFLCIVEKGDGNSSLYSNEAVRRYLNNAIDFPIAGVVFLFKFKYFALNLIGERLYRYLFRIYCRFFDKAVQL